MPAKGIARWMKGRFRTFMIAKGNLTRNEEDRCVGIIVRAVSE